MFMLVVTLLVNMQTVTIVREYATSAECIRQVELVKPVALEAYCKKVTARS